MIMKNNYYYLFIIKIILITYLPYSDFHSAKEIETRLEATVGGCARADVEQTIELSGRSEDAESGSASALYADTLLAYGCHGDVTAVRQVFSLLLAYLWSDSLDAACLRYMNDRRRW